MFPYPNPEISNGHKLPSIRSSEFSCHLKQAPHAALSLVNPTFDPTGSGGVVVPLAYLVRRQQCECQTPVVPKEFFELFWSSDARDTLVLPALTTGKIA